MNPDDPRTRRLPPPALPSQRSVPVASPETESAGIEEAPGRFEAALLFVDEALAGSGGGETTADRQVPSPEIGIATGIGDDRHVSPEDHVASRDPHVLELSLAVAKLAEALKRKGEAGLHTAPSMSRFEATLRSYCVGYLVGKRADDRASSERPAREG